MSSFIRAAHRHDAVAWAQAAQRVLDKTEFMVAPDASAVRIGDGITPGGALIASPELARWLNRLPDAGVPTPELLGLGRVENLSPDELAQMIFSHIDNINGKHP